MGQLQRTEKRNRPIVDQRFTSNDPSFPPVAKVAKFYPNSPLGVGYKTFVPVFVFISSVCVYIRVKPIITARIVTICWAVSQSVYDGRELNAAVLTSMVRAVWVSFCFDLKC